MRLLDALAGRTAPTEGTEQRFGLDTYAQMYFDGNRYVVGPSGSKPDEVDGTFVDYIHKIHRRHGVVAAAVATRALLISQVRFKWRRPDGSLYGTSALRPLERPGSMTRPALLSMLEHDASYSGTAVVARRRNQLWRLAPDKVKFVLGSNSEPQWDGDVLIPPFDAEVVGVTYNAGKTRNGNQGQIEAFMPGEFASWAPEPDPVYFWRGTSWVSSVVREVLLDGQSTDQASKYFENGSVPSMVFMMDSNRSPEEIKAYQDVVDRKHSGVRNRYKNLFLGGATDVKVLDPSMGADSLSHIQGTFENRVAVRSRIPAVVLGTKESLSGSSLNAGNYSSSRRLLADGWFSPTVDGLCAALESIVPPPADGSELGHDPSRVLFLQEDQKDDAEIKKTNAAALRQLVEAGYEPDTAREYIATGDLSKLTHTGNVSVQLQPPGSGTNPGGSDQ